MKKRKPTSASAGDAPAELTIFGEENSSGASLPDDDDDTDPTEHAALSEPASCDKAPPEVPAQPERFEAEQKPAELRMEPALAVETRGELEFRVRRLEDALAQLTETKEHKPSEPEEKPAAPSPPVAQIVPPPMPAAPIMTAPHDSTSSFLFNVGRQFLAPPVATVVQPANASQESTFAASMRWTWFFFEFYAELRAILRMYVDPRYQMSWASRLIPLVLAFLLFTSGFWAPGAAIPWIGTLIDKLIDLPLAFLLFKVLSHEARRYRQTSPDLPPALRLPRSE